MDRLINQIKKDCNIEKVLTESADLENYGRDWTKDHEPNPRFIVFPKSTSEVSRLLRLCNREKIPVVPSGGRTGLAGGAVASNSEVVISLDRMNQIEKIDKIGLTARVEAGVTTQALQSAAKDAGLFFALDLASKGSCQIGGNIATNAGGTKFIRYGGMREQVLGLEVVLADGRVLAMDNDLRKNNVGYNLNHLFIASEGTLGIITKAVLQLRQTPGELKLICVGASDFAKIPTLLGLCHQLKLPLTAFEFFTREAFQMVKKFHSPIRDPFAETPTCFALIEIECFDGVGEKKLEALCESALEKELIDDAVIASSSAQFKELWSMRENISESIAMNGHVKKNDISVSIDRLGEFVEGMEKIKKSSPHEILLVLFGHIGDGNLHINYTAPNSMPRSEFLSKARGVEEKIFDLIFSMKGSISAEHGMGLLKKAELSRSRGSDEIEIMRDLKKVFDPNGIMNPGKIFDVYSKDI